MKKITRRDFLKAAEVTAAGALALAGCSQKKEDPFALTKPPVPGTKGLQHGQEKWVSTICGQCPSGCGIRVRVVEGRAVKIEGNKEFPLNHGSIGPKGEAGLELLYHPDRIPGPLRRDGARGSGKWKPVSWREAIDEIGKQLRELRDSGESRSLALLDGEPRGMMPQLWARLLEAYGSPNHIGHRSVTDAGKVLAMQYMQGVADLPAYDWEKTRYVLGFGANLLESSCQTIHMMRAASVVRHNLSGRRGKFVHVSPRYSPTSIKADEWLPIEPATYGALALGLANILIRDKLIDEAFVREHTFGFEDWKDESGKSHRGFRDLVTKDYPLAKVAEITHIRAAAIERIAHEMAELKPAIVVADGSAEASSNGMGTAMAIHALNALLGNLERPGGVLVQKPAPLGAWKKPERDAASEKGAASERADGAGSRACPLGTDFIQNLPSAVLSGKPYPIKALLLYQSNPVFSKPDGRRWIEALSKIPLVVSFSPLPDESTIWADFVLPNHTYFEQWDLIEPAPSMGTPVVGLRQPVVVPQKDTMHTGDFVVELAKAIGGSVAQSFPWKDYHQAVEERLAGLKGIDSKGGWWLPEYSFEQWSTAFNTPSKKFEFYSQSIARRLPAGFPDEQALPHWEPPQFVGDASEYPFVLVPYRAINYAQGGVRHLPYLLELPITRSNPWKQMIELNPDDARKAGLADGAHVVVESPAGSRELYVQLHPGTRPGTLGLPLGHGAWPATASAEPTGGYGLLANHSDPLAGILAVQGTRVRIRKV